MADKTETESDKKASLIGGAIGDFVGKIVGSVVTSVIPVILRSPLITMSLFYFVGAMSGGGGATWIHNAYMAKRSGKLDSVFVKFDTISNRLSEVYSISLENKKSSIHEDSISQRILGIIHEMKDGPQAEKRYDKNKNAKDYIIWLQQNGRTSKVILHNDSTERFAVRKHDD